MSRSFIPMLVAALATLISLITTATALAVPADPTQRIELRQPDGTEFEAKLFGDEWYHGYETAAGYTVLRDGRTWEYAERKGEKLVPSGLVPGEDRPAGLDKHLRDETEERPHETPSRSPQPANTGTQRSLVILVQFADQRSLGTTPAQWNNRFFGATESARDYYSEVSYGALDLQPAAETSGAANDGVVGWLTLPSNHPRDNGTLHRSTVRDAIVAASPYVDFRSYDRNGNGALSPDELHVTVIPAGGEASSTCTTPSVWGHRWTTYDLTPTVDGVRVGGEGYTMFGEKHCENGTPDHMATLGIIVHELGHDLDMPDLYDVDRSSDGGVGAWSVMAYGSWNALPGQEAGSMPPHPDAFSKAYQGWTRPEAVAATAPGTMLHQAATSASAVRMLDNPGGYDWTFQQASGTGEYYLLENRQRIGYDSALPGCGVLVWHIDETRSASTPNATDSRRLVQLEEANGNNRPFEAGDAFVGAATFSGSRLYDGTASGVRASNFSAACGQVMTADLATGSTVDPPAGLENDAFAKATAIGTVPFSASLDTTAAGVEQDELTPTCAPIGRTVWFKFVAPRNMRVRANTAGSGFDTVLAAYRTPLGQTTEVGCADDVDTQGGNLQSSVEIDLVGGQPYYFQVGGYRDREGDVAHGRLSFAVTEVTTGGGGGGGDDEEGDDDEGDTDECASQPAPERAGLDRRRTIRVAANGRFRYRYTAPAGLASRISLSGTGLRARASFTMPDSGQMTVQVRLGQRTLRALRRGRVAARATVTLQDACGGTSTAARRFMLSR
jgi:M6 family metalloprotease-like protein